MKEKKKYVKADQELISLFKSHKKPYSTHLLGKKWIILPNVFSPKYSPDAIHFVEWLPDMKKKKFLEIGCGTGIIAIEAALKGAEKVIATDINNDAVKNTKLNVKEHNVDDIVEIRLGNLFESIKSTEKFDIIFFNLPFGYRNKPQNELIEKSVFDFKYLIQKNFLKGARKHLELNGSILIAFSTIGHIGALKENARNFGYRITELYSKRVKDIEGIHVFKLYRLIPR